MTDLAQLFIRWQHGWSVARGLPAAQDVDGGLRVHCAQPGRAVEYFAPGADADPGLLARLAARVRQESVVTWLTTPTVRPGPTAGALERAGLVLVQRAEQLMVTDLATHPDRPPAGSYSLDVRVEGTAVTALVRHDSGERAAGGVMGVTGTDAVADRILTEPGHRRRGLAGTVMAALARTAVDLGARHGVLIASADGQRLYPTLGWRPVADVVIAANRRS
ncbi:GNAT family N-acetyltransferase [Dactylosporangium vinaceum]|uniref:GNAT family N-acetyltransferase n=1 Tax=Dactylosporangium vinaceum TaxID=53362 RepID=A0ABV5MAV9_9ACTN|nr:GNAT family N-acetyltransferase [Dactylosporangium vinaceum]UAB92861.1 GNAT family N-acetyltransferase [Dactylosporangium vinaceum]